MKSKGISQEALKIIACMTMLIDHIGASSLPWIELRIIGRIAFPIFCFLLAEGTYYTKNPKKYGIRLVIGMLLAEIPFDILFYGRFTWAHQSVMVTLLLGFMFAMGTKSLQTRGKKFVLLIFLALMAEFFRTDYGAWGVVMIALFVMSREHPQKRLIQVCGLALISYLMGGYILRFGPVELPLQMFALVALIPIFLYDGKKNTGNVWVQWGFYLFYPVHLLLLYLLIQ